MLKVNNRNTRTKCEICPKLTIKTLERHWWRRFGVFIVNFEQYKGPNYASKANIVTRPQKLN